MTVDLNKILTRLDRLESEKQVAAVMHQYMRYCDDIGEQFLLKPLLDLFTEDAIWEGVGPLYRKKMGRHEGKDAISDMFAKYTQPPSHFQFNLHILSNQYIEIEGDSGKGEWLLLQPSDFSDGRAHLTGARITSSFVRQNNAWKIMHFQTLNAEIILNFYPKYAKTYQLLM